jgi:uncharacterized protein (TIGR02453 family)
MNVIKTVKFLKALKFNNNKEWFDRNRAEYTNLREDFYKLIEDIKFSSISFDKSFEFFNPRKVAYRINRDIRFSKDKSPYKSEFGALFAANKQEKENGYHFHINSEGQLGIGGGAYLPEKDTLIRIRRKIIEDPETFEEIIYNKEFNKTFGGLSQEFTYKKIPPEFSDHYELGEYLKLKGFFAFKTFELDEYKNENIAEFISDKFRILGDLVQYLKGII